MTPDHLFFARALVFLLAGLLAAPIVARIFGRRLHVLEPVVIFAVVYAVMFVMRPLVMLNGDPSVLQYTRAGTRIDITETFTSAIILAIIGAAGFLTGYGIRSGYRIGHRIRPPRGILIPSRVLRRSLVAASAGVTAMGLFALMVGGWSRAREIMFGGRSLELKQAVTQSSAYIWQASWLLIPATIALLVVGIHRRRGSLIVAGVGVGTVLILRTLPLGGRMMLLPVGCALAAHVYGQRRRTGLLGMVPIVLAALAVSTTLLLVRSSITYDQGLSSREVFSTLSSPEGLIRPVTTGSDAEMLPALASALNVIPSTLEYGLGAATIGDFVTRPIPRRLWSGKPISPRERLIATLWPRLYGSGVANPEFSVLLYFFWDAGHVGVFIGMLLFGILARAMFTFYRRYGTDVRVRVLYGTMLAFLIVGLRDSPVDTFMRVLFVIPPLVYIFSGVREAPASPQPLPERAEMLVG